MFTNEFGQTVKADWVGLSVNFDELSALGTTIIRSIVRSSAVGIKIEALYERYLLHASLTNVSIEPDAKKLSDALGIDIRYFEDSDEYDAQDSHALACRILELIFNEGVSYELGNDSDVIIKMNFDDYIKRTHGL